MVNYAVLATALGAMVLVMWGTRRESDHKFVAGLLGIPLQMTPAPYLGDLLSEEQEACLRRYLQSMVQKIIDARDEHNAAFRNRPVSEVRGTYLALVEAQQMFNQLSRIMAKGYKLNDVPRTADELMPFGDAA